jgi:bacillithiol system protein YtxJ
MEELATAEQWERVLAASDKRPVFVFKHSTRCPISGRAYDQVTKYLAKAPADGPEFHLVNVIEARPVSNAIADALGVKHQSPQLILVKDRKALCSSSHFGITEASIGEAVARFTGPVSG